MRLITIRTPVGEGKPVLEIAFNTGIKEATINTVSSFYADGTEKIQDVINIETNTPHSKAFVQALMDAPFYDPKLYSFTIRHPEALFSGNPPQKEVHPVIRSVTEVYQELYQLNKITFSLAARIFCSGILLSYGMVEDFMPLIIAGLLFLPYHHFMIGIAMGSMIKEWRFLREALLALLGGTALLFLAGACVALVSEPPVLFEIKGSILAGAVLAAVIGFAAALASIDDAGKRELIGLAATAHISVYPAWIGLQMVFGDSTQQKVAEFLLSFLINIVVLIFFATVTYAIAGTKGSGIRRFIKGVQGNNPKYRNLYF